MKHVFVETNFLIDVARPFRVSGAEKLLSRCERGEVVLHVPWCSVTETRRTLNRVIREDLGFTGNMMRFAKREQQKNPAGFVQAEIDRFEALAEKARDDALARRDHDITQLIAKMKVIPPSEAVIAKTVGLFEVKNLKPFDEMTLGAVLARASELHNAGERELFFCTLDKKDLAPSSGSLLEAVYSDCGLQFRTDFAV